MKATFSRKKITNGRIIKKYDERGRKKKKGEARSTETSRHLERQITVGLISFDINDPKFNHPPTSERHTRNLVTNHF